MGGFSSSVEEKKMWRGVATFKRRAGEEELKLYLRGRCAAWPVKAPSSEHM